MADYKSCAWYQKGTCIRDDKSGAPISCADCEDYERRVVFKIEDLQERNGEMSVRKSCKNCKHFQEGFCNYAEKGGVGCLTTEMERWELSDDAKADLLHDDETEHDIPKYKSCINYELDLCPMAKKFADKKGVKLDCSNCKDYLSSENNCGDCKHYNKRYRCCYLKSESEFIADLCPACNDYEEKREEKEQKNVAAEIFKAQNHDTVSHPSHYTSGGIECIDCIKAALGENFMGFLIGNVIKYTYRYKDKNGIEDLRKGMKYLEWAIQELEKYEKS